MNIPHALAIVIQRSRSLAEILDKSVELIANAMGTDVCSIYLMDSGSGRLHLAATRGLDKSALGTVSLDPGEGITGTVVQEMRPISVEDASSHPGFQYFPETREEEFHSFLGVPFALRNRPVGAIVVQTRDRRVYTEDEQIALTTIAAQLVGVVENARLIYSVEGSKDVGAFEFWRPAPRPDEADVELLGGASSRGIAIGEAVLRGNLGALEHSFPEEFHGAESEVARIEAAITKTQDELLQIQSAAEEEADEEHALIFSSHLLLLNDQVLRERIHDQIRQELSAERAAHNALQRFIDKLEGLADPYIRDRVEDIWDLRNRLLSNLQPQSEDATLREKIVIAPGIAPSLVVELKTQGARGIVTERGGPTSHGALLARSMGIPAVTGVRGITARVQSGDRLILDGSTGRLYLRPSPPLLHRFEEQLHISEASRVSSLPYCHLPGRSRDGVGIPLQANIGVSADLAAAKENGAEGIGLYRTEFPFMIREDFPTRDEQVRIYRRAYEFFPEQSIRFRLLDLGGDKILPYAGIEADTDPFGGYRSLRVLLDNPSIVRDQVQALVLAASSRSLELLLPMVSSLRELQEMVALIRESISGLKSDVTPPRIGAMIEVPAAVEIAPELARSVDFFSIGSNDLIQYTLAANRDSAGAARHSSPYHPAVLRMIARVIEAGHAADITVALCGVVATEAKFALALLGLGIDSLSLEPGTIPELKTLMARANAKELRVRIPQMIQLNDADDIEQALAREVEALGEG